jgi:hypothetical protein
MVKIVTSVSQVIDNVRRFNQKAEKFAGLMPYYRSWYALRTDGSWLLGPSKYIGYSLSPEEYLGSPYSTEKHGRGYSTSYTRRAHHRERIEAVVRTGRRGASQL